MKIIGIALNTFRESARNKIFYLLLAFGLFFVLSSHFISILAVGDKTKVLEDIGLAAIHFFTVVIAIFTGINLIYKEIEKKTIYNVISKPISRSVFILGTFCGLALTLLAALLSMAAMFMLLLKLLAGTWDGQVLLYFAMLFIELLILTALSLFFSAFTTPILSFIFTLSLFVIGHIMWTYNEFKLLIHSPFLKGLTRLLYYLLPNLHKFNIKNAVVVHQTIDPGQAGYAVLYGICYIGVLLTATILIFHRREFQ